MLKKFTPEDEYSNILSQFCYKCERTYKNLYPNVRRKVKDKLPTIFKKWFFSSALKNAVMSPAVILTKISDGDSSLKEYEFADIDLYIKRHKSGLSKYGLRYIIVSPDSHPLIEDLKAFIKFCSPVIFLDNGLHLDKKKIEELKPLLCLADIYYIDYITELAVSLGLIEKMPSLYADAYTVSAEAEVFFMRDGKNILNDILIKVFDICARKMAEDLYLSPKAFTPDKFSDYFRCLIPINDIIKSIFGSVNIDIEAIIEKNGSGIISEDDRALLSSVNYVGYLMDRWYITPLSIYLRLIRPIYPDYYDITDELNIVSDILSVNSFPDTEIFIPPNIYVPTPLGRVFTYDAAILISEIPGTLAPKALYSAVNSTFSADKFNFELEDYASSAKIIYTLTSKLVMPQKDCIVFEFDSSSPLSELSFKIADFLDLPEGCDYSFIKKVSGSAEIRYAFSTKNSRLNVTEKVTLSDVFETIGESVALDIPEISARLEITLTKISSGKAGILYPRPVKRRKTDTEEGVII